MGSGECRDRRHFRSPYGQGYTRYMYIYIYMVSYARIYNIIYIYMYIHPSMYVHTNMCTYICLHRYVKKYICTYLYTYIYIYIYTPMYISLCFDLYATRYRPTFYMIPSARTGYSIGIQYSIANLITSTISIMIPVPAAISTQYHHIYHIANTATCLLC